MKRVLIVLAVVIALVSGVALAGYRWASGPGHRDDASVDVFIAPGSSGRAIAQSLESHGVIGSAFAFRIFLKMNDVNADLKAGEYKLRKNMSFDEVVAVLRRGPEVKFVKLVIPEGLTIDQTAAQVGKLTHIPASAFLSAASPVTARPSILPPEGANLEGFLYPATYYVDEKESAQTLVKRLVAEFERRLNTVDIEKAAALQRTPYEILIIASMIEEEAKLDEERSKISAVIHNRLGKSIPLGIDATIQYAVKKYAGEPLTQSDLEIDSPFNTRKRQGLPPWPIASPRVSSITAALQPAGVDYLYYVLDTDCKHHVFTSDYSEFERAKARQPRNC